MSTVLLLLTSGQFYAPEEPGERVLSLGSDQSTNTILVSGDASGFLQIWDISHFALDIKHQVRRSTCCGEWRMYVCVPRVTEYLRRCFSTQPGCARPPLLRRWKAHKRMTVSAEVVEAAEGPFVLTASADGAASLWTKDGDHMGCFGQEELWNMSEPATYQRWGS